MRQDVCAGRIQIPARAGIAAAGNAAGNVCVQAELCLLRVAVVCVLAGLKTS